MQRAAEASALLDSAEYEMETDFKLDDPLGADIEGRASLNGRLTDAGQQLAFLLQTDLRFADTEGETDVSAELELVVAGQGELYVRLQEYSAEGARILLPPLLVTSIKSTWLRFGSQTSAPSSRLTPDPRLLHAQAEVVQVTQELPPALVDTHHTYHYRVRVVPEKLVAYLAEVAREKGEPFDAEVVLEQYQDFDAQGELWIDAESFHVRRLEWELEPFSASGERTYSGNLQARFWNFNQAEPIAPPADAQTLEQLFFTEYDSSTLLKNLLE